MLKDNNKLYLLYIHLYTEFIVINNLKSLKIGILI